MFEEWLAPAVIAKAAKQRLMAPEHKVYFAGAAQEVDLLEVWRVASLVMQAYPEAWVELRWQAGKAALRVDEAVPVPLTFVLASEAPSALLQRQLAAAQGGVLVWREHGVPEWAQALTLNSGQLFGWIGNHQAVEALQYAEHSVTRTPE